jgi:hypothetical protein
MLPFGGVWQKIVKCVPAIVAEVEKKMADGVITPAERKDLVLSTVDIVAAQFGVKLGWMAKMVIGWIVDQVAKKLPSKNIVIPDVVIKAIG